MLRNRELAHGSWSLVGQRALTAGLVWTDGILKKIGAAGKECLGEGSLNGRWRLDAR